ncbi:hypothetical protein IAR50_000937 [Cryptococcus sp. DSM 104548]
MLASHNKENTSLALTDIDAISLSLRSSLSGVTPLRPRKQKHQGGIGIGRAPKHTCYPRRYVSGNQPYARTTSITRAKLASASSSSSSSTLKGQRRRAKPRPRARPPPLKFDHTAYDLKVMQERVKKARYDPANRHVDQVRLPLKLPFPQIPPIERIDQDGLKDIPVDYILNKILPLLPSISTITLAYKSYPQIPHPDPTVEKGTTLALAIPEIMDGRKPEWQAKTRGREPDVCLVLAPPKQGQGQGQAVKGGMAVAVSSLAFASQCAHWPKLVSATRLPTPPSTTKIPTPSETAVSASLPMISESDEPTSSSPESESEEDENEYEEPLEPAPLPSATRDKQGFLHLPIIRLSLPSPATFPTIHRILHHPALPSLPILLGFPEHLTSRTDILSALADLPVQGLMEKAAELQGVWRNLCALGVGRMGVWRQLGEAWGIVIGIIAGHGLLINGQVREQQRRGGGGSGASGAEEVAWEWVGMVRERERVAKEEWMRGLRQ